MTSVLTLYPSLIPVHSIEQIWIGNEDLAYDGQMLFIKIDFKLSVPVDQTCADSAIKADDNSVAFCIEAFIAAVFKILL